MTTTWSRPAVTPAAYLFITDPAGRVLMLHRGDGGPDGSVTVPSVPVGAGDPMASMLAVETERQTGILFAADALRRCLVMHRTGPQGRLVDFYFTPDGGPGTVAGVRDGADLRAMDWHDPHHPPSQAPAHLRAALMAWAAGRAYLSWSDGAAGADGAERQDDRTVG